MLGRYNFNKAGATGSVSDFLAVVASFASFSFHKENEGYGVSMVAGEGSK